MLTVSPGKFVIRRMTFMIGLLAIGCSVSNPVAPSSTATTTTPSTSAPVTASVSQVLPASIPPSPLPQTLRVEGQNFKPGLTVAFTFTPASTQTPAGRRLKRGDTKTLSGPAIHHLTETSFQCDVLVTEFGTYTLSVMNPEAPPSDPVTVESETNQSARPAVTSVSPASPTPSAVAQALQVSGTNFEEGLSAQITRPNGAVATFDSESIVFDSAVVFQIMFAFEQEGSYSLRVMNYSGQTSEPWAFTVGAGGTPPPVETPTPSINGLAPESPTKSNESQNMKVAGASFAAGMSVELSGPGNTTQTIEGSKIWDVTPTWFRFSAVLADAGEYSLRAVNASGKKSPPWTFTVKAPEATSAPTITAVDPGSPTQNSAATSLYVLGTHFAPGLVVKLTKPNDGGTTTISESAITFGSSTAFHVMVTLAAAGTYSLRVVNPSGQMSEPRTFTVQAAEAPTPSVSSISPESITKSNSCQVLTISGQNFVAGLTVKLTKPSGGTTTVSGFVVQTYESSIYDVTSSSFKMCAVLSEAGGYSLKVTNPSGKVSEPRTFTVTSNDGPAPTVTAVSPTSLQASGQSRTLTVTGTTFQSGLVVKLTRPNGETSVIGGDAITLGSSTSLQVIVTLGTAGHYYLRVKNSSGQMSEPWEFTVSGVD